MKEQTSNLVHEELRRNKAAYWKLKEQHAFSDGVWIVIQNEELIAQAPSWEEAISKATNNCFCVCVGQEEPEPIFFRDW